MGALLAVLALPAGTIAQSALPSARLIPVDGMGFELRMSPDGKTAAVFDQAMVLDNEVDADRLPIRLIDLASGEQVGALNGFTDYAADVAFAPDGSSLASLHWNGDLYRWNLGANGPEPVGPFMSAGFAYSRISFLPDSRTVVARVGDTPQRFFEYDTQTGAIPHIIGLHPETWAGFRERYLGGVPLDISYPTFAISPDGSTLATVTSNSELALWSLPDGQPEVIRPKADAVGAWQIHQLAFTPDSSTLVYFDLSDGRTHLWDVASRVEVRTLPYGGTPFALSRDGQTLAWAEEGSSDSMTNLRVADLSNPFQAPQDLVAIEMRRTPFASLDLTPDGTSLVAGGFRPSNEGQAIVIVPVR
jgi:WD40 repeat protein